MQLNWQSKKTTWVIVIAVILIGVGRITFWLAPSPQKSSTPQTSAPSFRGPTGSPRTTGPTSSPPVAEPLVVGQTQTLTGRVIRNETAQAKVDGGVWLEIITEKSGIVRVQYSGGDRACLGEVSGALDIQTGVQVEARGKVYTSNALDACLNGGYVKLTNTKIRSL